MRSNFNQTALVRQLAAWLPAEAQPPRQDRAERLGQWLHVADAIALHAALLALPGVQATRRTSRAGAGPARAALEQVRETLSRAIAAPPALATAADDTAFAPHHQRCLDQQRRMDMAIEALRDHLRRTLAQASPGLAQLATLDATLGQMLGGHEQKLLAGVPAWLKARFEQLRQSHPDDWPPLFEHELQQTLLAELDLRLQPLLGLVEALEAAPATN